MFLTNEYLHIFVWAGKTAEAAACILQLKRLNCIEYYFDVTMGSHDGDLVDNQHKTVKDFPDMTLDMRNCCYQPFTKTVFKLTSLVLLE